VQLDAQGRFIKILVHKNHINKLNIYSQVGTCRSLHTRLCMACVFVCVCDLTQLSLQSYDIIFYNLHFDVSRACMYLPARIKKQACVHTHKHALEISHSMGSRSDQARACGKRFLCVRVHSVCVCVCVCVRVCVPTVSASAGLTAPAEITMEDLSETHDGIRTPSDSSS
jgi:hypothetical protein